MPSTPIDALLDADELKRLRDNVAHLRETVQLRRATIRALSDRVERMDIVRLVSDLSS